MGGTATTWGISQGTSVSTVDSYSETNQDAGRNLSSADQTDAGQSFTTGSAITLDSCKFYLKKTGSPTGNATAILYAHTGTYGTDGTPTGSALGTSDTFDVSTLTTSYALATFNFSGANRYAMSASTHYFIILEYSGGDASNRVVQGIDGSSPTHGGNHAYTFSPPTWNSDNTLDTCFYVYGV